MLVHDFSPANGENIDDPDPIFHLPGLFWLVRIGDNTLQFDGDDRRTAALRIHDQLLFDRFQAFGPGNQATHMMLNTIYQQQPGRPTIVTPLTNDPLSPFNWAGTIFTATAHGTFSARYDDGTFAVTGTIDSAVAVEGTPGHMGHERNGVFALGGQQRVHTLRDWRHVNHAARLPVEAARRRSFSTR